MSEKKYTFIVEWFDPTASVVKQFYFTYFMPAHQVEMVDLSSYSTISKIIKYSSKKYNTLISNSRIYTLATSLIATIDSWKL